MTCGDVAQLLDAFVDAELPAPMLLAVARHAGGCADCDRAVRELTALHEAIERSAREAADALDLSGVWPAVRDGIAQTDTRRLRRRLVRTLPAWGAGLAAAASLAFWLLGTSPDAPRAVPPLRPNHAVFERIDSGGARFELRRERKLGTTLLMVSADGDEVNR